MQFRKTTVVVSLVICLSTAASGFAAELPRRDRRDFPDLWVKLIRIVQKLTIGTLDNLTPPKP